ncbi:YoaK family protein [Lactococcus lactis]|uniref:YoaK family protein n=1 Tax=Lactococcus lactis TaxID=1358 RepID=UPI0005398B58|nr:YoaK family protein [Lactococcus lactis]
MNLAFYEKIHFAMYLTFIGGAMDTYTFLKYNAFPVAHSGNLILALSNIYTHHYDLAIKKGLAVLCFFLGVLFARLMQNLLQKLPGWEVYTLFFEAIIFSLIGFPIFYNHPSMVIALIAFTVSIQWVLFNTVEGHSYINLYVSGNIKGLGLNLINYINNPEIKSLKKIKFFIKLILCFFIGAILSLFFFQIFAVKSCFFNSLLFASLAIKSVYDQFYRK